MTKERPSINMTLGEFVNGMEDSPWIYCGSSLVASPIDDLLEKGSFTDYVENLGLSYIDVDSYECVRNLYGEEIVKVYLDPLFELHILTAEQIVDIAKDLMIKYDLTKQQGLAAVLINSAHLPKAKAARLLNITPQALGSAYKTAQLKINTLNDNSN